LKQISYEIVEEPLREWTPWMKEWSFANNERSRVPVLRYVLEENVEKVMPESNEMNLFIDSVDEKPEFTPFRDSSAYVEMTTWWKWCAEELKPMIDLYKYGVNLKFDTEAHVFHTAELQKLMQVLEDALIPSQGLSDLDAVRGASEACDQAVVKSTARGANERSNKEMHQMRESYLVEERLTLADIAIIPFIRQIMRTREGEFDFSPFPRVLAWTNSIIETDWFKNEVMKKS
jgi:glutathione S-transferase